MCVLKKTKDQIQSFFYINKMKDNTTQPVNQYFSNSGAVPDLKILTTVDLKSTIHGDNDTVNCSRKTHNTVSDQ